MKKTEKDKIKELRKENRLLKAENLLFRTKMLEKAELLEKEQKITESLNELVSILQNHGKTIQIPKKMNLNGKLYSIKLKEVTNGLLGLCRHDAAEIWLKKDQKDPLNTFLHEIGHDFNRRYKIADDSELFSNLFADYFKQVVMQLLPSSNKKGVHGLVTYKDES